MKHLIYTLSVKEIIDYCWNETLKKADQEYICEIDLRNRFIYDSVVVSQEEKEESAYLYQMLKTVLDDNDAEIKRIKKELIQDVLLDKMVILDFGHVFSKDEKSKRIGKKILDNGIIIKFPPTLYEGEASTSYLVAADKSSSMAKDNKIYYVSSRLDPLNNSKEDANSLSLKLYKRLMLGTEEEELKGITTYISKIYSYRGLYLTDSFRIKVGFNNNNRNTIQLNASNVIIIDDEGSIELEGKKEPFWFHAGTGKKCAVIKAKSGQNGNIEYDDDGRVVWTMCQVKDNPSVNPFDGEGLICKEYAEEINKQLKMGKVLREGQKATSFQVRMPFCKGMLHQVSWEDIIKKVIDDNRYSVKYDEIAVIDIFGIPRLLKDAKIIMTKSMFKCWNWWNPYCQKNSIKDPAAEFFQRMKQYDHSLYVSNTNASLANSPKTLLNYQFLNPLKLSEKQFKELLENQKKIITELRKDPVATLKEMDPLDLQLDESVLATEDTISLDTPLWQNLIYKNEAFLNDWYIKNGLGNYQLTLIKNIFFGRLLVDGQLRYLSGDLIALIAVLLARGLDNEQLKEKQPDQYSELLRLTTTIFDDRLDEDEFYMPDSAFPLDRNKNYAFLRNPHLSRFEECVLKPKHRRDLLYGLFLADLKGIVMVGAASIAPATLSGADFDGDLVRIIADQIIVSAVMEGTNTKRENGRLVRNYPFISIPSPSAYKGDIRKQIDSEIIIRTFSNRVGHISNMAVRFGQVEYDQTMNGENVIYTIDDNLNKVQIPEEQLEQSLCAEGCVLVGLEIDANKNGSHPSLKHYEIEHNKLMEYRKNTLQLKGKYEIDYLYHKNIIKALDFNSLFFTPDYKDGAVNKDKFLYSHDYIEATKYDQNQKERQGIDLLPWASLSEYYSKRFGDKHRFSLENTLYKRIQGKKCFWFEESLNEETVSSEVKESLKDIVKAFEKVCREAGKKYRMRNEYQQARYFSRVRTILKMQYTDTRAAFDPSFEDFKSVEDLLLDAYLLLVDYIERKDEAEIRTKLLERIITTNNNRTAWLFTTKDKRQEVLENIVFEKDPDVCERLQRDPNLLKLLTTFHNDGYNLLYYLAKDIFWKYEVNKINDDPDSSYGLLIEENDEMAIDSDISFNKKSNYYQRYREEYLKIFATKSTETRWKNRVLKICRDDVLALFDSNTLALDYNSAGRSENSLSEDDLRTDLAMAYLCKLRKENIDRTGTLFWNIFTREEIERNIINKDRG